MSVASWILRNRNIRSSRFPHKRTENTEDVVRLNYDKDPYENAKEILSSVATSSQLSIAKLLNYLNAYVKLLQHVHVDLGTLGFSLEEILYCLRVPLVHESTQIRSAALRAVRHTLTHEQDVCTFNGQFAPIFVVRSLDLALKNDFERIQALKLMRKILKLNASAFDVSMARSLVSLANCGVEEKDRLLRACLACLCEIGVLNTELFISAGGVAAITRNLLECQTPRIAESLCGVLLLLLDRASTRSQAGVDLHCIAAAYCDFHYRHGWMDKNRDERELRFNCSRLALLTVLRSWSGILYFCNPKNTLGLKAIVDVLYLNQLEVRKAVLDLLYELLGLPQPEWTDELSVALSAVDPAEPQAAWRLSEGFVAAEGRSVLPHLTRTTPSVTDIHLALLLYCFLETGLLGALEEVIASSDTFISVRATVLLGELLRLIQLLLPPECCNVSPALPNLLDKATRKPQAIGAITALQQLHKLLKRRPASSSLFLDYILQSGNFVNRSTKLERNKKCRLRPTKSKLQQLVMKEGENVLRETGVLQSKDIFTWNWNVIKITLKGESDFALDVRESTHLAFCKHLIDFYKPSNNRYSHMDLASSKHTQAYTSVGIALIDCLIRIDDTDSNKLLLELFQDIAAQIAAITASKSAHDCLFSPQHMMTTQCQSYFLFIGRFASTKVGMTILNQLKLFAQLQSLVTTTNHDCYVKLIVSSLDYRETRVSRELLLSVLRCPMENSRLYATQFLLVLLRAGVPQFATWGIKLLTQQLEDKSRAVQLLALAILHEACELPNCLDQLVNLKPDLEPLGERGVLLSIRFLSTVNGYQSLDRDNAYALSELKRWDDFFNFRYVRIVEGDIADALTLHQRGDDGRYDKRLSALKVTSRKDLFVPPHIYGQLAKHAAGFQLLLAHGSLDLYAHVIRNGRCESDDEILLLKAALWVMGHLGGGANAGADYVTGNGVLCDMLALAQHCPVYSVRATAFFALNVVATTHAGAISLRKLGWACTRHDRHNRWPVIEEEEESGGGAGEEVGHAEQTTTNRRISTNSECSISTPDVESNATDEELLDGVVRTTNVTTQQQKSLTLPYNQNAAGIQHKRSLSESKTFDTRRGLDGAADNNPDWLPGMHASFLSPIPSLTSLTTTVNNNAEIRVRRYSETRRVSTQSTSSDRSTISPVDSITSRLNYNNTIGYSFLRSLRPPLTTFATDDDLIDAMIQSFGRTREGSEGRAHSALGAVRFNRKCAQPCLAGMSLNSLSSVQQFSIKDETTTTKQPHDQCYMGICLPMHLANLFPPCGTTQPLVAARQHDDTSASNVDDVVADETPLQRSHSTATCLNCARIKTSSSVDAVDAQTMLKCSILKQIEWLSNPVWMKHSRQTLLHMKQQHACAFQDACLYSDVCKLLAETTYRLSPRRLIQELFLEVDFAVFEREAKEALRKNEEINRRIMRPVVEKRKSAPPLSSEASNCRDDDDDDDADVRREPAANVISEEMMGQSNHTCLYPETIVRVGSIKTLDSLNLSYKQNKFPIRDRSRSDPQRVVK